MDAKLNHSELSAMLAKVAGLSNAKAEAFTKAFFDIIIEGLENDGSVKINGLGTFKITDVASRESVNVNTGEKFEIKGHKKLTFIPADALKEKVNQPFAMFEPVEIDDSYVEEEEDSEEPAEIAEAEESAENVIVEAVTETANPSTVAEQHEAAAQESAAAVEEGTEEPAATQEPATAEERETPAKEEEPSVTSPAQEEHIQQPAVEKKKSYAALYIILAAALIAVSVYLLAPYIYNNNTSIKNAEAVLAQPLLSAVHDTVPADTATVAAEEPNVEEKADEPYAFVLVDELAAKSVAAVGLKDTLLYTALASIATHKVAENETLTRISLKYYGDKRLWPYIVKYNNLHNPNGLSRGMSLEIPRLVPANR